MNLQPSSRLLSVVLLLALPTAVRSQDIAPAVPRQEHKWLQKFVGSWTTVSKARMGEGQPESEMKGTIKCEMLGEFWLTSEMTADVGGFQIVGRQTIGYDQSKKSYIGTWIDTTNDFMWQYTGKVMEDCILSLEATGPDMAQPGKTALYRDMYEFVSADEIKITSSVKDADGNWIDYMTGTAKRVK